MPPVDAYDAERQEILKEFGLKLARRRLNLDPPPNRRTTSQREVAERAGLHYNEVGFLERGEREPTLLTILALASALSVKPGKLLNGLPAPKEPKTRDAAGK